MGESQESNRSSELCRIEQLPDEVLLIIISFLPTLADMAKTSCLCRKWRNMWYGVTCLDFNATALLHEEGGLRTHQEWYVHWVDKIIDSRVSLPGLPPVKELRIKYNLNARHGFPIEQWIYFAIANRVETLQLDFAFSREGSQYVLSEKPWEKSPSGLSSLALLKSLSLDQVSVTKQFIEFVLSNCPLLEDLALVRCGRYNNLDVSGAPPLRLRRLKMAMAEDCTLPMSSRLPQHLREKIWKTIHPSCSFDSLKTLKLYGGEGRTIDQDVIVFIIDKSPNLKKLIIEIRFQSTIAIQEPSSPEIVEVVKAKAKELCHGRPYEVEITVIG